MNGFGSCAASLGILPGLEKGHVNTLCHAAGDEAEREAAHSCYWDVSESLEVAGLGWHATGVPVCRVLDAACKQKIICFSPYHQAAPPFLSVWDLIMAKMCQMDFLSEGNTVAKGQKWLLQAISSCRGDKSLVTQGPAVARPLSLLLLDQGTSEKGSVGSLPEQGKAQLCSALPS